MLRVVLKGLLAHKVRLLLTALSVVIGVAFVAGSFILTDSIEDAFAGLFEETSAGTDLYVRPASAVADDLSRSWVTAREPLPAAVVDEVAAVDGVAAATGWVEGAAQIVGPDGEAVGGQGPPVLGFSWSDAGPLEIRTGRPPRGPGEVVVDAVTAEATGYAIGDTVPVITLSGAQPFRLVGIAGFGASDNLLGATIAAFDLEEARRLFDKAAAFDQVAVRAEAGADLDRLRDRVDAALGGRVEVVTAQVANQEGLEDVEGFLTVLESALLAFAFVAMFVGAFIIANTFSIIVAQRVREFALLRALGASARQVRRAVRGEALVVGVVASAVGLVVGIGFAQGLRSLLDAFGLGIPTGDVVLAPRTVAWSFAVGIAVTLVASHLPARRAAVVAPVEAMRGTDGGGERGLGRRTTVGAGITAVGLLVFAVGAFGSVPDAAVVVGVGALAILLGVATLSPALARPIAAVVGAVPARTGVAGRLAQGNAGRDRRRTAVTASALMIALALVAFGTVFAASATQSASAAIDEQFSADLSVASAQPMAMGVPPTVAEQLAERSEFATVSRVRVAPVRVGERSSTVAGVEPDELADVVGLGEVEGDLAALGADEVFVQRDLAAEEGWRVGDRLRLHFAASSEAAFVVAGTYEHAEFVGAPLLAPVETVAAHAGGLHDAFVFLLLAPDTTPEQGRTAVEAVLEPYPNLEVHDRASLRQRIEEGVDQVLGLMLVLLALAILVAFLGITNTLVLAVFERTREIGLLRAVGMTRRQVRNMVRWESTIVATFGALLGVVVGALFGWAIVAALREEGFSSLVVPVGQLALYVVVAAAAGVVAAALPARRAARLDVLEAVTHE